MALTILTAGLAACGLLLLLWSVAEAMLLPLPREDAVLVAPLQGGAASRIFRLSVPKAATIFSAVFGPTPRTAREER